VLSLCLSKIVDDVHGVTAQMTLTLSTKQGASMKKHPHHCRHHMPAKTKVHFHKILAKKLMKFTYKAELFLAEYDTH